MKPIRKAVRTFLIEKDKVLAIKYTTNDNKCNYYDIPGGKIEDGETKWEAAIREFKEETGMNIYEPKYAGTLIVEYPNRVFDFSIFIVQKYDGVPQKTMENVAEWIKIDELLKKEKRFAVVTLLDGEHKTEVLHRTDFKWHFTVDENHNKVDEIYYSSEEKF